MPQSKTNQERAARIGRTLGHYVTKELKEAESSSEVDAETAVTNFLSDLRHYCYQHSLDIFSALDLSYRHYLDEKAGIDDYLDKEVKS